MRNVILTGIPRSGTTLAAALIDGLTDCVCLNEPVWQTSVKLEGDPQMLAAWLAGDYARIKEHLLAGNPVPDRRSPEGKAITNFFEAGKLADNHKMALFIRKGLTPDFTLAMKHNALYFACLPYLALLPELTIIALIRNPIQTIASWRRVSLPVSEGRMPHAALYWPEIKTIMASSDDVLTRQVKLYDAMCHRLQQLREAIHILPYEFLIDKPSILCNYLRHDGPIDNTLIKKETHPIENDEQHLILEALKKHGEHWQEFYPGIFNCLKPTLCTGHTSNRALGCAA